MNLFLKIIKNPLKGAFQKGSIEDPELTSFHRLDKSTGTHGMISPEKELQTTEQCHHNKRLKGHTEMNRRDRDTESGQKPMSGVETHN